MGSAYQAFVAEPRRSAEEDEDEVADAPRNWIPIELHRIYRLKVPYSCLHFSLLKKLTLMRLKY